MDTSGIAEILANLPDMHFAAPFSAIEKVGGNLNLPFGDHAITTGNINLPFGQDAIDVETTDSHDKDTTVSNFLNPTINGIH